MTLHLKDKDNLVGLTAYIFRVYKVKPRRMHGTLKISAAAPSKWHHIPGYWNLITTIMRPSNLTSNYKFSFNVARNKSSSIQNYMS